MSAAISSLLLRCKLTCAAVTAVTAVVGGSTCAMVPSIPGRLTQGGLLPWGCSLCMPSTPLRGEPLLLLVSMLRSSGVLSDPVLGRLLVMARLLMLQTLVLVLVMMTHLGLPC